MLISALRKRVLIFAVATLAFAFTSAAAAPIPINVQVLDDPGEGFNDPVSGPARQAAFRYAADLWGSFFQKTFPTQAVDVGIRFDPFVGGPENAVAFSTAPRGRPFVGANFVTTLPNAENLVQARLSSFRSTITFNSNEEFFLGTTGNPGNKLDLVTFALHELGHIFGFITQIQSGGAYAANFPSLYDFFVVDAAGKALVDMTDEDRIAAATNFGNLFWGGENGVAGNGGIPPNLAASTTFNPFINVVHLSETFGPDVLMDPNKDFGEVIHALSPLERGMFEDLVWTLAPLQSVVEPPTWLLLVVSLAVLACAQRRRCGTVPRPV